MIADGEDERGEPLARGRERVFVSAEVALPSLDGSVLEKIVRPPS